MRGPKEPLRDPSPCLGFLLISRPFHPLHHIISLSMSTEAGPSVPTPLRRAYEPRAPLVNQVDADSLDDGIAQMLGEGVERAIHRWRVSCQTSRQTAVLC